MDTPNAAPSDQYLEPQRDTDKYEGHTVILRKNKAAATARQMQTPSPSQSPVPRSALVLTRDAGTVMRESTEIASDPLVADNFHSPIGMAAEHQPLLSDSEGYRAPLSAGAMRVSDDIRYTQWSVPPPQHSQTDREADYRFGASISWKLGSVMGVSASVASLVGYLFIPDTNIANTMMPFIVAIGVMLIHALLLLAISLRLGAYRAPHAEYHHSRPTWLYSNPVSKIRIHTPSVLIVFGVLGFSGGTLVGLFLDDYSLMGYWPFIPVGALCLCIGWLSLLWL